MIDPERVKYLAEGTTFKVHSSLKDGGYDGLFIIKTLSDGKEHITGMALKHEYSIGDFLNLAYLAFTRSDQDVSPCFCGSGKNLEDCCTRVGLRESQQKEKVKE